MNKKVLVVGGAGFLGSHVADALSDSGYEAVIFDRISSPWLRKDQGMIIGNILEQDDLNNAMKECKYVYHLAGVADIGESAANPVKTIEMNIMGSVAVIEACLQNNVERMVFSSSVYVYSQEGSFYRVSKQAVESILEKYQEECDFNYTILRFGSLYGPRSQQWNGVKRYIAQAVNAGVIEYNGTGEEKREFIHVMDAAKLSVKALSPEYENHCLNITGSQVLSIKELLEMIKEIIGKNIDITFNPGSGSNHYTLTPYRFTPKIARKIVPETFYDVGQGILDLVEEIYHSPKTN